MNNANNNSVLQKFNQLNLLNDRPIFDWRSYWYLGKRKKWFLIVPAILFSLAGFYYRLSVVPVYDSSTTILVSDSKLMTGSLRSVIPGVTAQDEISGVKNYILSAQCITGLITTLELKMSPAIQNRALMLSAQLPDMTPDEIAGMLFIDQVRASIKVESTGRDVIKILVENQNPQRAYLMTKTLAQVFMEEFQKRQVGGIRGVREFSEEQLVIYKDKLEESEERLKLFKEGVLQAEIADLDLGKESLDRFKSDMATLEVSVRDKEQRLQAFTGQISADVSRSHAVDTPAIAQIKREIFSKIDELVNILGKFTWKDPQIIEMNDDINTLRERIRTEVEKNVVAIYTEKDAAAQSLIVEMNMTSLDIEILNHEKQAMSSMVKKLEQSLTRGPSREMALSHLQQEVEQNRQIYLKFLQQSQGTQIEEQIQRRDAQFKLQVIEMAKKPLYPTNMGAKMMLILLALPFVGVALGGGIVFGLDYLDHSIRDVHQVEKELGIPVWGIVPEIEPRTGNRVLQALWTFLLVAVPTLAAAALIYIVKKGGLN